MCGIAGQLCYGSTLPDRDLLEKMSERLAHRGPDGQGTYVSGRIGLAHRRLAIIDLSDDARQPIANEDGSLQLVYNGEIYNFVELRAELVGKGHIFGSKTDSEVILHAYEEWGTECLPRLNGMWAFALWDEKKQQLFCARDRFGIKPFYYTEAGGSFLFASEIKALLAHPEAGKKPDDETLLTYLAWGVLDHSKKTMFDGIFQLRPAHAMVIEANGHPSQFQYWDINVNPAVTSDITDKDAASHLLSHLRDAVRIHLRSDVAVGTCLSGGIDSSTLAVLINELIRLEAPLSVGSRQKTFSAVFTDPRFDESRYIDEVVAVSGVDAYRTEPSAGQVWDDLQKILYMQDEPFGSLSIYAQYCVMRLAAERVKVVLDGQGADELLAGYLAYEWSYIRGLVTSFHWYTAFCEKIGALRHYRGFFWCALPQLFVRSGRRRLLKGDIPKVSRYGGTLDQVLYRELTSTNLTALLHYEDRNAMAFSIESRVPYLDLHLVEYIASLPLDQKIRAGVTKHVLRRAVKGLIPESIRCRMDKMGFVTPEEDWMKSELRPFVLQLLTSVTFHTRPYWDADAVVKNYLAFLDGRSAYSPELFCIVCAELWLQMFFDTGNTNPINVRVKKE
ncbi:MAG: asparagine synthase (glutamine-hydrolyzing) [Methanoregula sp.]|nr:asparagine synthase (glutamine-hydrolyzing) [Methanoregula sp.]